MKNELHTLCRKKINILEKEKLLFDFQFTCYVILNKFHTFLLTNLLRMDIYFSNSF